MRRSLALFVTLAVALLLAGCGSKSSTQKPTVSPARVPVVATMFSNLKPAAGRRETVRVTFFEGSHLLSGARLSVTISYGKHTLSLRGGVTNKKGIASATFTVPRVSKGTILHAITTLSYKGKKYRGSNQVSVV